MTSWEDMFRDYMTRAEDHWGRTDHRQVRKLHTALGRATRAMQLSVPEYLEFVIEVARSRQANPPRPIHLVNLGGSGSHWISRMLDQAGGAMDAGEIYLPAQWYETLTTLPRATAAPLVDAIELGHALAVHPAATHLDQVRVINSAHGYDRPRFHQQVRHDVSLVHILRDPRDRVLSVSLRKPDFRAYEATGMDDLEYLASKSERSASAWNHLLSQELSFAHTVRYEDMKADTERQLGDLLQALGISVPPQLISSVARRNDAERLRADATTPRRQRGNLDAGGRARGWRTADPVHRRTMHSIMAPAITGQGYPLGSCFPDRAVDSLAMDAPAWDAAVASVMPHVSLTYCRDAEGSDWSTLDGAAPAHGRVRLRIERPGVQAHEVASVRPLITDVCAAGHEWFSDADLDALGEFPELRTLDVAGTGVARKRTRAHYPRLQFVNYSGLTVPSEPTDGSITEVTDY